MRVMREQAGVLAFEPPSYSSPLMGEVRWGCCSCEAAPITANTPSHCEAHRRPMPGITLSQPSPIEGEGFCET